MTLKEYNGSNKAKLSMNYQFQQKRKKKTFSILLTPTLEHDSIKVFKILKIIIFNKNLVLKDNFFGGIFLFLRKFKF